MNPYQSPEYCEIENQSLWWLAPFIGKGVTVGVVINLILFSDIIDCIKFTLIGVYLVGGLYWIVETKVGSVYEQ